MVSSREINSKISARQKLHTLFTPHVLTKGSFRDEDREHIGINHLPDLNKIIAEYYAPQRSSNSTAMFEDEISGYVAFLERRNNSLSLRLAELERKFKAIEPYVPYIPTIARIVSEYTAVETRIEEKKKYLREKYSVQQAGELKLWTGAVEQSDIADKTLDEMFNDMNEDE